MTKLVDEALSAIQKLPPDMQDDLARFVLAIASEPLAPLSADEATALSEAEAEIAHGKRVPAETMRAFWHAQGV